jgi:dihydroneopterin aldolase
MASIDTATAPIFSYPPLKDASKEIRLLRFLPTTDPDDNKAISVNLEPFNREHSLVYDALSYTWGNTSKTKTILVNGCRFEATENLHAALLQLRGFEDTEDYSGNDRFWIDALSINQKDNSEKSLQVQMMRNIFSEAAQVIVWLGTPAEESHLGMETIASLTEAYNDYKSKKEKDASNSTAHYDELLLILKDFLSRNHASEGDLTKSIRHIFQMPWWDRVWIIQEVAVAKQAWVLFGDDVLGFEYFRHLYNTINELQMIPNSDVAIGWSLHINQISACTNRAHSVLRAWLNDETSLFEALKTLFVSGSSQATNPSDKFYALLGLRVNVESMVGR